MITIKLLLGYRNLEKKGITEYALVDDIVIFAPNEKELKKNLEIWKEPPGNYKKEIN